MNPEEIRQAFLLEARGLLRDAEDCLLRIEVTPDDKESMDALFRAIHTIKGSGGIFGYDPVVTFAHIVESVLDDMRNDNITIDDELIAVLLTCVDHIGALVDRVVEQSGEVDPVLSGKGDDLLRRLQAYAHVAHESGQKVPAASGVDGESDNEYWNISLVFSRDALRHGIDPISLLHYLATLGEIVGVRTSLEALPAAAEMDPEACYVALEIELKSDAEAQRIADAFEFVHEECGVRIRAPRRMAAAKVSGSSAAEPKKNTNDKTQEHKFIYVRADKLDALINLVGELVIAGAGASLLAQRSHNPALQEAVGTVAKLVDDIRANALQLRMVPIGETFNRFKRVVHDIGRELNKDIELIINGAETELDKAVVERISDPLTHLVRNAIDHGIEAPARRRALGKPEKGTVWLNAFHDSGSIVIEVRDDGAGLDHEAIRRRALERGIIGAEDKLSRSEIDMLIFQPGFSTAEKVTNLSGRGVGMDVVQSSIEALRGATEIDSHDNQGTTVRIRLPLTLAIIDGFLMSVGNTSYAVPLDAVVECIELDDRLAAKGHRYLDLRGEVLPFVRLREQFKDVSEIVRRRRENVVVVQYGGRKAGLVVDTLMGESQMVIRPLGRMFHGLRGVSGATVLGSGDVALILDVPALIQRVVDGERALSGAPGLS